MTAFRILSKVLYNNAYKRISVFRPCISHNKLSKIINEGFPPTGYYSYSYQVNNILMFAILIANSPVCLFVCLFVMFSILNYSYAL